MLENKLIIKSNDENSVVRLLVAMLAFSVVTNAINCLVNVFAPGTPIDTMLCLGVLLVIVVFAFPTLLHRFNTVSIIAILVILIAFGIAAINPKSSAYVEHEFTKSLTNAIPFFFVAQALSDGKKLQDAMIKTAPFVILMAAMYYAIIFITGGETREDNMAFSYYLLPFSSILLIKTLEEHTLKNILLVVVAFVVHILCGTRGPVVCFMACFVLATMFSKMPVISRAIVVILGVLAVFYINSEQFIRHIQELSEVLEDLGMKNRILDKLMEDEFLDGSGRETVRQTVLAAIGEAPVFGHGFLGDRIFQNGGYPHNFVLEMWCQFGILFGTLIMVAVGAGFLVVFLRRKETRGLYIMLFVATFVKMMLSGSYIYEGLFFLLLGLMTNKKLDIPASASTLRVAGTEEN